MPLLTALVDPATTPPDTAHAPRLDAITGLRWWAAFGVFAFHIAVFAPLPAQIGAFFQLGDYGVAFFFVLSGFVLTYSMRPTTASRRSTGDDSRESTRFTSARCCWRSRLLQLHPDPQDWWVKPFNAGILMLSVLLLQGWSRDPAILFGNPAAWTLTVEAFFYALHPFLAAGLTRMGRRGALIAAGVVAAVTIGIRVVVQLDPGGWVGDAAAADPAAQRVRPGHVPGLGVPLGWRVACTVVVGCRNRRRGSHLRDRRATRPGDAAAHHRRDDPARGDGASSSAR